MTNKEALNSLIFYEVSSDLLDKVLLDNGITGSDDYSAQNSNSIELCSAYVYKVLVTAPDFKQGTYSLTNKQVAELKKLANNIFRKYNKDTEIFGMPNISINLL